MKVPIMNDVQERNKKLCLESSKMLNRKNTHSIRVDILVLFNKFCILQTNIAEPSCASNYHKCSAMDAASTDSIRAAKALEFC